MADVRNVACVEGTPFDANVILKSACRKDGVDMRSATIKTGCRWQGIRLQLKFYHDVREG